MTNCPGWAFTATSGALIDILTTVGFKNSFSVIRNITFPLFFGMLPPRAGLMDILL
jgi:hypothetical protein